MKSTCLRSVLLAACVASALVATPGPAQAQNPGSKQAEISGVITGDSSSRLALAVPPTVRGNGARVSDVAEIAKVLKNDLDFSGWFGILDEQGEGRALAGRMNDPSAWRGVGAQYLVNSELKLEGDRGRFSVQLIETGGGDLLLDKTWGGRIPEDLRRLAHVASDEIVEHLTGQPGIAQTRISFVAKRGDGKEVYLMDYDGARVRRLTSTGTINLTPTWSPDGRRLTFLSFLGRKPSIYLLDEKGEVETLRPKGGDLNAAPDFSPGGNELVFSSDRDGNSELYLYDLVTDQEKRLTRHPAIDTAPAWAPDGRRIAFTSDRTGGPQIYVMNSDGSDVRRLSWEGRYNESAAWSPNGDRLAFVSRIAGRFEIVIHELASGKETVITRGPGNKENPSWAPDGRHLVFTGDRSGTKAIYSIRDDGTDMRQLTRGPASETPDWSPLRG